MWRSLVVPVAAAMPPSWLVLMVMAMAAWLIHLVLTRYWLNPCSEATPSPIRLLPGSRGLPVIGESLEFFARSPSLELIPFLKRRLERYGPIFRTNLIGEDLIVSLDPELTNLVFQQEKMFQIWYPESMMRIMGADCIIATLGSFHKHLRSLVLRLFGPENLRLVLLRDVQRMARASLLSWLHHPSIELKKETSRGRKNVMKILRKLLDDRKKAPRLDSGDFLDLLIEDLNQDKYLMNEMFALDLLFALLFAGFEITSSGITAVLRFLTDDPKALQELTEEHDNIQKRRSDPDSEITWEEYKSMKFTSHVIHEALRLSNIVPIMFRKATKDVHINGYTIPKGSKIMIVPSTIHLNPAVYEDPNTFNPWRWKDTAEPVGGASKEFMAFGGGLRLCVGADFAKMQIAIFLHCLVTKYRWKAIKGGTMVLSPGLQFPDGFYIQLLAKVGCVVLDR